MRRRAFIGLFGGAVVGWPFLARAQQSDRMQKVVVVAGGVENDPILKSFVDAFREELHKLGWIEGRNVQIEARFAVGGIEEMRAMASEVLRIGPDVIVSNNTLAARELQRLSRTVPIIFVTLADPVDTGIVTSLAHPDRNTTGFMNPEPATSAKWLELLKQIVPSINHVLVMVNAGNAGNAARLRAIEAFAPNLEVTVSSYAIRDRADIETAINTLAGQSSVGIIVAPASPINDLRKSIFALAEKHRLPAIYGYRYYAVDGGLMSYGAEPVFIWQQGASYVDRILRGTKPGDLPVQGPTKLQLVVNLKAAKAIGLTIKNNFLVLPTR